MILVSKNIKYMWIFAGVPLERETSCKIVGYDTCVPHSRLYYGITYRNGITKSDN